MPANPTPAETLRAVNPDQMKRKKAAYQAFLHSPAWKAQRAWVLDRDDHQCRAMRLALNDGIFFGVIGERCQETTRLTVHHLFYSARGIEHTPNEALVTVCRRHHDQLEALKLTHRPR